jgi:hypothetical protein
MPTPFKTEDERGIRYQISAAQQSLGESFALIVKRLRETADEIERQTMRATECALNGDLAEAHVNAASAILNEIAWLTPNLPTAYIVSTLQSLVRHQAILRQMGLLITDEERAGGAARAVKQGLVDQVKGMIEAGAKVKVRGFTVADVSLGYEGEIIYRLKLRKFFRTATREDVAELACLDDDYVRNLSDEARAVLGIPQRVG